MLSPHNGGGEGLLNPKILKNLTFLKHINFWQYSWPEPNSEIFIQILNPMRTGYCGQKIAEPNFAGWNLKNTIFDRLYLAPDLWIRSIYKSDLRFARKTSACTFFSKILFFFVLMCSPGCFLVSNLPLFFRFDASVPMYQYIENVNFYLHCFLPLQTQTIN